MSKGRSRLIGGALAAGLGSAAGLILALLMGPLPGSAWTMVPIGLAIGGIVGFWLSPALVRADGVKTGAVGLAAGVLSVPLVGLLGSVPYGIATLLAGNLSGLIAPFLSALFIAVIGVGALVVSIPAGLVWAALTRRTIGNGQPSTPSGTGVQPTGNVVPGRRRKPRLVAIMAGGLVVLLWAAALRLSPLWPGPALPPGAMRLHIATEAPHLIPNLGCPAALLGPVRVATVDDDLIVVSVDSGEPVPVVWPSGWAAWRLEGRAELVDRDGTVVAREGEVIEDRFGGGVGLDDAFHVCVIGG